MSTLQFLGRFLVVDVRNLLRDPVLAWVPILPLGLALLLRIALPVLEPAVRELTQVDPEGLHPLIMGAFVILVPALVGAVSGMLIVEEREEGTLAALLLTPVPFELYLTYRVGIPTLIGLAMTLVCYPLAGLTPLGIADLAAVLALASLTAPLMALLLACFSSDRVSAFAVMKLSTGMALVPVAAFFYPAQLEIVAGLLPTYWPMRVFWDSVAGDGYAFSLGFGFVVNLAALALLLVRLRRTLSRGL